jgi:hypothetical protein
LLSCNEAIQITFAGTIRWARGSPCAVGSLRPAGGTLCTRSFWAHATICTRVP